MTPPSPRQNLPAAAATPAASSDVGGELPLDDPEGTPEIAAEIRELHGLINDDNITIEDVEDLDHELSSLLLYQLRRDSATSVE